MSFIFNLIPGWLIAIVVCGIAGYIWIIFNSVSKAEQSKKGNAEKTRKYWNTYQEALKRGDKAAALDAGRMYYLQKRLDRLSEDLHTNSLSTLAGQGDIVSYGDPKKQEMADEQKIQNDLMAMDTPNKVILSEISLKDSTPQKLKFNGNKDLSNDAYKLYLLDAYSIKKNDVLEKFICMDKIFPTVDEAIAFAAVEEKRIDDELEKQEIERIQAEEELKAAELKNNEQWESQLKREDELRQEKWVADEPKRRAAEKKKRFLIGLLIFCTLIGGIGGWKFYEHKTSYLVLRDSIQNEGWRPLVRPSPIQGWDKPFPEVYYCSEGYCAANFINKSKPNVVRAITYEYCGHPYGGNCQILNFEGFMRTSSDKLITRKKSDEEYEWARKRMKD
jgi:hypothetical protein